MTNKQVTDIFRDHSIVITNVDSKAMNFKEAIYSLKAIDEEVVVIDQSIYEPDTQLHEEEDEGREPFSPSGAQLHGKTFAQTTSRHCIGTLRQVMESVNSENPKSLNVLDIAAKSDKIPEQPLFSDKVAWDHTTAKAGENYPTSDMRWALASSGWTQHRWHQDSNGFATVVTVQSGIKWWYIGSPRKGIDPSRDSGGILRFLDGFDLDESNSSRLDVEVVVLTPTDWLFLRPQTFHAVITPVPTVVDGGHFIASVTIRETCFGIYDDFIAGRFITNTEHHKASFTLLSRLLILYHKSFLHPGPEDIMESVINHIPDLSSSAGVIDLFCFCHLFELYGVLCSWQYNVDDSVAAALSRRHVIKNRKLAREIKEWFFCHYDLKVFNGAPTSPSHARVVLDHKFLAQQCQALLTFKVKADQGPKGTYVVGEFTFKRDALRKAIRRCLKNNPDALAYFESPGTEFSFNWDKRMAFTVHKKRSPIPMQENIDGLTFDDIKHFQPAEGQSVESEGQSAMSDTHSAEPAGVKLIRKRKRRCHSKVKFIQRDKSETLRYKERERWKRGLDMFSTISDICITPIAH
ncbi:hypothetical protein DXG01_003397 [Tephrocybe rancida]|nr:hypothetical protein DXG01_003397 [Tephrocybe rancida]